MSLVTSEMEGLSVLQVTSTCRAKVTCDIPEELLLETLLGFMPHVMLQWYKDLSNFSLL
jgi:hypothetical protein